MPSDSSQGGFARSPAYERRAVEVRLPDTESAVAAVAYRVRRPERLHVAPSAEYIRGLIRAAVERGLPDAYVRTLQGVRRAA